MKKVARVAVSRVWVLKSNGLFFAGLKANKTPKWVPEFPDALFMSYDELHGFCAWGNALYPPDGIEAFADYGTEDEICEDL